MLTIDIAKRKYCLALLELTVYITHQKRKKTGN